MPLTLLWVFRIFTWVRQSYGDEVSLVSPEGGAVNASHTPEEVPAALPGEPTDLSPDTSAVSGR